MEWAFLLHLSIHMYGLTPMCLGLFSLIINNTLHYCTFCRQKKNRLCTTTCIPWALGWHPIAPQTINLTAVPRLWWLHYITGSIREVISHSFFFFYKYSDGLCFLSTENYQSPVSLIFYQVSNCRRWSRSYVSMIVFSRWSHSRSHLLVILNIRGLILIQNHIFWLNLG